MQRVTATDQYWWRYGSAKFDAETTSFEVNTRRAVASSILVCCRHMPLRCPLHTFLPTHLDCIVYSLQNYLNLRAKSDGNGPILMKIRLGEVWCSHDEFRSQHSPSHIFIDTGLLSTYYAYNCSSWCHISSCESRSRYDIGVLFIISTQHGGSSTAALSWFVEVRE